MNISENNILVTVTGNMKINDSEIEYLESLLRANDRGGYYMALFNMTGQEECLLQARIATFSDSVGGAAFVANILLQSFYNERGRYPGVYFISQQVAERSLLFIERNIIDNKKINENTGYLDRNTMFASAEDAWRNAWKEHDPNGLDISYQFPGNLLSSELMNWMTNIDLPPLPNQEDAWTALAAIWNEGDLTAENFMNRLVSSGALAAFVAVFGAEPFGKRLSDYEDMDDRYRIDELPDAGYSVVTDLVLNKVVAVIDNTPWWENLDEAFNTFVSVAPELATLLFPAALGGINAFKTFLNVTLDDVRRNLVEGMPGFNGDINPLLQNPEHGPQEVVAAAATEFGDTLWGKRGSILSSGDDEIHGLGGDDRIFGGGESDALHGDDGDDMLYGQSGSDELFGGQGRDILRGGNGDDTLHGGSGDDMLDGEIADIGFATAQLAQRPRNVTCAHH